MTYLKKKKCEPSMDFKNEVQRYIEKHEIEFGANFSKYYKEFATGLEVTRLEVLMSKSDDEMVMQKSPVGQEDYFISSYFLWIQMREVCKRSKFLFIRLNRALVCVLKSIRNKVNRDGRRL